MNDSAKQVTDRLETLLLDFSRRADRLICDAYALGFIEGRTSGGELPSDDLLREAKKHASIYSEALGPLMPKE